MPFVTIQRRTVCSLPWREKKDSCSDVNLSGMEWNGRRPQSYSKSSIAKLSTYACNSHESLCVKSGWKMGARVWLKWTIDCGFTFFLTFHFCCNRRSNRYWMTSLSAEWALSFKANNCLQWSMLLGRIMDSTPKSFLRFIPILNQ